MPSNESVDEPTPLGGDYSEIYYLDDKSNVVDSSVATHCVIRECGADGSLIAESWGIFADRIRGNKAEKMATETTAWTCVEHLSELGIAVPCDHTDIWMAARQRKIYGDFEDNLVIAAAIRSRADVKTALLWLENLPSEDPA